MPSSAQDGSGSVGGVDAQEGSPLVDAPAWAHSPTGDHSPRARRNAWGAASTSGLPSWASTPPTEPEPSWAEDGIRPPKV